MYVKKTGTIYFSISHRVAYNPFYTSYEDTTVLYIVKSKIRRFYQIFCHLLRLLLFISLQGKSNYIYYNYFLHLPYSFTN